MFSNISKPAFGTSAPGTSFGLGTTTTNTTSPWGNSGNNQLFGKPANTGFGQQPSTSFGQPATSSNSMFPFFPSNNTSGFGSTTTTQPAFGSNIFGQQQPATNNLFSSNAFGQQKPAGFGFGTQNQQQTTNLFGQTTQPQNSLFQPSGTATLFGSGNAAFGASTAVGTGTTVKFNPVTGSDTMQKAGVTTGINTKHHCITCMKEYEGKSLEELRLEDYQANRKGPQSQFGATPFGGTSSMFGQTTDKPAFGQTTGFGQISGGVVGGGSTFGQQAAPPFGMAGQQSATGNIFGKPSFGTPVASTSGFGGFNSTSTTNAFGAQPTKPFGAPVSATPIFGVAAQPQQQQQQQAPPFGTNLFGQQNTSTTGSFFNKPAQTTGFGATGFSFNQTATTTAGNLFQQSKPVFGLGQPATSNVFGQTTTFGQNNQQNAFANSSTFGKPLAFGQNQSTFQPNSQTNLFSNTQQKPGSLLGGMSGGGLFSSNNFGTSNPLSFGLSMSTSQPQTQGFSLDVLQESKNLSLLASNQFGHSPYLTGLLPADKPSSPTLYTTNPVEIKKMLENNKKVGDTTTSTKLNLKLGPPKTQRDNLFEEGNDEDVNKFYKTSCKRLVLKKKQDESKQSIFETTSIFNDLSTKSREILSPPQDVDKINELNISKPFSNTPLSNNSSDIETKYVNKSFPKQNLEKLIIQKGLSLDDTSLNVDKSENRFSSYNSSIIDVANGLEESARVKADAMCQSDNNTHNVSITMNPLAVSETNEGVPRDSVIHLDSSGRKVGPSGIILTRAEYYTLPPIEELDKLVGEDGRCVVKGFTVGRKGYGNVYFPEELNVKNLDLDEIVHFRYREIHMYPDESKKPPMGEGLNRRAQVTLDRVYPRAKETKEIIDNVEQVLAAKFPEQLVEISAKHGLKFLDYRPETGSWVFMVEHFSKYAFTESDEEDCEMSVIKQKNATNKVDTMKSGILSGAGDHKGIYMEESRMKEGITTLMNENADSDMASEYTDEGDHRQGDVLHKSMTIDLDENDDFMNPIYDTNDNDLYYHNSHVQMMKATFFSDSECASTVSTMDFSSAPLIEVRPPAYRRRPPQRPKVWNVYVNSASRPDDSLLLDSSRCYSDMGLFRGKSCKIGWSKGFGSYAVKFPDHFDNDNSMSLTLTTIKDLQTTETFKECIIECMKFAQECSDFTVSGSENVPTFHIMRDRAYLMACHKTFKKASSSSQGKSEWLYHDVWSLCNSLWGPGRRSFPFVKSRLSAWLKSSITKNLPAVRNIPNRTTEERLDLIFTQLTCFNLKEAAEEASNANMPNLAMLISQMNASQKLKAQLVTQIETWQDNMYADHISAEMIKIYMLLAGVQSSDNLNVCDSLDWKRVFGIYLWYLTSHGSPVQAAIEAYRNGFSKNRTVIEPKPSYECDNEPTSFDMLYHILELYNNPTYRLSKALNPETYTNNITDYQLSWLLLLFFKSVEVGLVEECEEIQIHTSFSSQLEENGLWDLAILPLLYLRDNSLKRNLVLGILNRNLPIDDCVIEIEERLVNDYHVPLEWIEITKTVKKQC